MYMGKELNVSTAEQYTQDMRLYAIYTALHRVVPDIRDGFKDVQRKIIYTMYKHFPANRTVKSSSIVGTVMDKYHPHGDAAIYGSMKPMVNWFEANIPLIEKQGNFGNFQGDNPSAMRYTEAKISKFALDAVIGDLKNSDKVVDWEDNYSRTVKVPSYLAPNLPMLLINGSFGIAVGLKVEIPKHNISEVIDATVKLIDHPNADITLIPDQPMECEIIDTDFANISKTGYGTYKVRGKIDIGEFDGKTALFIRSLPDLVYLNEVIEKIESMMEDGTLTQIHDTFENSDGDNKLEYIITLKKGSDPNFVRDTIYKCTSLQKNFRVNFEVLCERLIVRMGYKDYLLRFIDFRKHTKYRLYSNLLQEAKTDYHQIEAYIRVMQSGEIDSIIDKIRHSRGNEESLISYMVSKFKITDLQARVIINRPLKHLSPLQLSKYKEDAKVLKERITLYTNKVQSESELTKEIRTELLEYKKLYGRPRRAKVITQAEASDIPEGRFIVVITKNNMVRKIGINSQIKAIKGDNPKIGIAINNTDNIVLFDELGKCYSFPVHKIPLTDNNGAGIAIQYLNKKITSDIIVAMPEEDIKATASRKERSYVIVLTKMGYIKKMEMTDFVSLTTSGIFYTKLDQGDIVRSIAISGNKLDVVVYSDKKALRFPISEIPLLKRSARGVKSIGSKLVDSVDGMCIVSGGSDKVAVVTKNGFINKFNIAALPTSQRGKSGSSVIKLGKTDVINSIHIVSDSCKLQLLSNEGPVTIDMGTIPDSSSISTGSRYIPARSNVLKAIVVR